MARKPTAAEIGDFLQPITAVEIKPPNLQTLAIQLIGLSPLMVCRFSLKAIEAIAAKQAAGSTAKKGRARAARDFGADFEGARHVSTEGWDGIHASCLRNGAIDACRLVGFKMTLAKMSIFVEPDGFDRVDGVPLLRILGDPPEVNRMMGRNKDGTFDIRIRPMWRSWRIALRLTYDADQFRPSDAINLIDRVGRQVGIGEGRPFSRNSAGMGMGLFRLATEADQLASAA